MSAGEARERLGADDGARVQADDRLTAHGEPALGQDRLHALPDGGVGGDAAGSGVSENRRQVRTGA